ncbi:MAG: histidine kinase [Rhizobacter sp.]|nr:histidine kinase [Rhizobacter sp.]
MRTLYLRIYLTVVAVLLLFALVSGWVVKSRFEHERLLEQRVGGDRLAAWAELAINNLPPASAGKGEQRDALVEWSERLRLPLALDNEGGDRVAASPSFERREQEAMEGRGPPPRTFRLPLTDGRTLWVARAGPRRPPGDEGGGGRRSEALGPGGPPWFAPDGTGLAVTLVALFIAVAVGAYPVVRRLTRRLELLKQGVEAFGAGALDQRVPEGGSDEVAAVAVSFNRAAARVATLVRSHQSLLANASHELRSPLARMKMAVSMLDDATPAHRERLKQEINTNIGELDALVEEVLLASRLDASAQIELTDKVDLLAVAAEEASRVDAQTQGAPMVVPGNERLLRRALRNLLENARRYGGSEVTVDVLHEAGMALVRVCDRGPGVPEPLRDRIFEPFYRLPGHAEQAGGVGLGLSLVKQIAERHSGRVRCEGREGGGSCFVLELPAT